VVALKTAATSSAWMFSLCSGSSAQSFALRLSSSNSRIDLYTYDTSETSYSIYGSSNQSTAWHIYGATYNQSIKKSTLYVDGVAVATMGTALTNGLNRISRISMGENYYGGAKLCSIGFAGIFTGTALTAQNHEDIYNANCLRFGLSQI
jgi:hypothetical protein